MLHQQLKEEIKDAMRAKDALRLEVLRGVTTAFVNELVAKKRTPQDFLEDEFALPVVKRLVKQRKDSIAQYEAGGRPELAEKEKQELTILETYLPKQLDRDAIIIIAKEVLAEGASPDKSKIGQLVGAVVKKTQGNADGTLVKSVLEELLAD